MAEKKYVSDNAQLMSEWHWEKNIGLGYEPQKLTCGSGRKVWWMCSKNHEWEAKITDRSHGCGCPFCAGQRVLRGYNDLKTINPALAAEWNYIKNGDLIPENFTSNSGKKAWWKCSKGHEWQAAIDSRNRGNGCPYCAGQKLIQGYNDLLTLNPTLSAEWNYEKNGELRPENAMANSVKKVWWKCSKGHEWQAKIDNRNRGDGCPYCSGRNAIRGENDLQTINPILASEWNYERNNGLTPVDVMPKSGKMVWWKCNKGHEWRATIAHRNNGNGCPICNSERKTSFPEYAFVYYLKKYGFDVVHSYRENGYELDVYIPSQKTAIEFDGYLWHKNRADKDLAKNKRCQDDGIKLYRIRAGLDSLNDSSIDFAIQKDQKDFPQILERILLEIIGSHVDVDITRDTIDIDNLREYTEKVNSLLFLNPELATEWNYKKNGKLMPENFTVGSHKKVWWLCSKGHEWQATIASRNSGCSCPYCSGRKVLPGFNDLQTINPLLASEWNYQLNGDLKPEDFTANSGRKVWWRCDKGHEWQAAIYNRSNGRRCPQCTRNRRLHPKNSK